MKNKESYYMNIPATVWDTDLNPKAILCYGHITVLANKGGFCYANNKYFEQKLGVSTASVKRYLNELESLRVIKRHLIYKDNNTVEQRRIYLSSASITDEPASITHEPGAMVIGEPAPGFTHEQDNTTSNNNTSNNIIDVPSDDDIKGKIFFKIVERYPKNRVGNRQHGLKKFKQLDINQAKLAARNLKRYLKVAGEYVKNLQNYITEECWSEEWLKLEETKHNKKDITNTKTFLGNYDDLT